MRELTFDQITDIHINQGILARVFNCGSLVFVTKTGLGRRRSSREAVTLLEFVVLSTVLKRRDNTFWDILEPEKAKELLMNKLTEWRSVYQQQSMAQSLGVIAGRAQPVFSTSTAEELTKFKNLYDNGAITKEEYEKAKQKLLN